MKKRKILIAGNWKMYKTPQETREFLEELKSKVGGITQINIAVCPPFTSLIVAKQILEGSNIKLGAQNVFYEEEGAFTGEISCKMLKDAGCEFVIIGHSERRKYFQEDNTLINKKIKVVLRHSMKPIFCIGETLQEREENKTFEVLNIQLEEGLRGISIEDMKNIVIAYEPVWAIGTGKTATSSQAQEAHRFIRDYISKKFSSSLSEEVIILYGGSIKPHNIKELVSQEDVDGGLVGGASLSIDSFVSIIQNSIL